MAGYLKGTLRALALIFGFLLFASSEAGAEEIPTFSTSFSPATFSGLHSAGVAYDLRGTKSRLAINLPTKSGNIKAWLEPHDIRSAAFHATISSEDGEEPDPVTVHLFKGAEQTETKGEYFRFALVTNPLAGTRELHGFYSSKGKHYRLAPSRYQSLGYSVQTLSDKQFKHMVAQCGVEQAHSSSHGHTASSEEVPLPSFATASRVAEIATEADYEFFQKEGNNSNAVILSILNAAAGFYAPLNLEFQVVRQNVWKTSNDPYNSTAPEALLIEFLNHWNANFARSVNYDLAHLWTGKKLDGSVIGVAYLGEVCRSHRYGLSQYLKDGNLDPRLVAHEIGHNFGAQHDVQGCSQGNGPLMCPNLQPNSSGFSSRSLTEIASFLASSTANCVAVANGGGNNGQRDPVLNPIGPREVTEGDILAFTVSATDPDGDSLSFRATGLPPGATYFSGRFRYAPAVGTVPAGKSSTSFAVTFTVVDATGRSDSETVIITVAKGVGQGNRSPVITAPGTQRAREGQLFSFRIRASDPDGDVLSYHADGLPPGAILDPATGILSWKPGGNQAGAHVIRLSVEDPVGASANAVLRIEVGDAAGVPVFPARHVRGDFNGNGKADLSVFRVESGMWFSDEVTGSPPHTLHAAQFGLPGDIPVPADYDGDGISDYAVYRPKDNLWIIRYSNTGVVLAHRFGITNDIPAPGGDYDGDGRDDLAVFRPSTGLYIYRTAAGRSDVVVNFGKKGDIPVPCNYESNSETAPALYRPPTGEWITADGSVTHGALGDIPVAGNYNGEGRCEYVVWRPQTGEWIFKNGRRIQFGLGGDVPVPADYNGDGKTDIAVFRPSEARWYIRGEDGSLASYQLGLPSDVVSLRESTYYGFRKSPGGGRGALARGEGGQNLHLYSPAEQALYSIGVSGGKVARVAAAPGQQIIRGDYDGDGAEDTAVFSAGFWTIYLATGEIQYHFWGRAGDTAVSGDFDGDGRTDITIFRPDDGAGFSAWYAIRSTDGLAAVYNWGIAGDMPIAADFNGDGWTDPAVWRPGLGMWFVLDARSRAPIEVVQWGLFGDIPRVADFDGDGRPDKIVWRESIGTWFVLRSGSFPLAVQWGLPGDIPVPGSYSDQDTTDYAVYRPSDGALYFLSQWGVGLRRDTGLRYLQVVGTNPTATLR